MLYREIIAVCSQIHTKHIKTLCGQDVELLNVKYRSVLNVSCYSNSHSNTAVCACNPEPSTILMGHTTLGSTPLEK